MKLYFKPILLMGVDDDIPVHDDYGSQIGGENKRAVGLDKDQMVEFSDLISQIELPMEKETSEVFGSAEGFASASEFASALDDAAN